MNPAIVAPDGFDIIDMTAGGQIHPDQRRNLGSVAKVLQHAASNKLFDGENTHLSSMNNYLSQTHQKFRYICFPDIILCLGKQVFSLWHLSVRNHFVSWV